MNRKILIVLLLLATALFQGCVGQNINTQTQVVATNGTAIIENFANSIFLQQGETEPFVEIFIYYNKHKYV